jgi:ferredoxin
MILDERCVDCGGCIRSCPHKAIKAVSDPLSRLEDYRYTVALPDPALYGQFQRLEGLEVVLDALTHVGFDAVFETARGAELLSDCARRHPEAIPRPVISSACPAVLRLIRIRFPDLLDHITSTITPVELSALLARRQAEEETGLPAEEIGVFSIVPCSSQVTAAHWPDDLQEPVLDGAFSIRDVYLRLLSPMRQVKTPRLSPASGKTGLRWAYCGGEASARCDEDRFLAVDGMENVIRVLEGIEDDRVPEADFVELRACPQGCVGGCLTVEEPYVSVMRLQHLLQPLPELVCDFDAQVGQTSLVQADKDLEFAPVYLLDPDRTVAMEKMAAIGELEGQLPGLMCGSCGAPSCHAFAEDVVLGRADRSDCIFQVRARMRQIAGVGDPDHYLPAPFRKCKEPPGEAEPAQGDVTS